MKEPDFDADAVIAAMVPLLGLVVGEASRAPVKTHLAIAARYAALQAGELDFIEEYYFPLNFYKVIAPDPKFQLKEVGDLAPGDSSPDSERQVEHL